MHTVYEEGEEESLIKPIKILSPKKDDSLELFQQQSSRIYTARTAKSKDRYTKT
jgi:hypothetical protein